jgi:hypothetical protein
VEQTEDNHHQRQADSISPGGFQASEEITAKDGLFANGNAYVYQQPHTKDPDPGIQIHVLPVPAIHNQPPGFHFDDNE